MMYIKSRMLRAKACQARSYQCNTCGGVPSKVGDGNIEGISDRGQHRMVIVPMSELQEQIEVGNEDQHAGNSSSCACRHVISIHKSKSWSQECNLRRRFMQVMRVMQSRISKSEVIFVSYEVPGGLEGSPWGWPVCCC
jgi:hypothetical protein